MKLILTALIALCSVAATFAEEGKFGPAWVEGHNYKVVDGQLVDLGPAPTPTPTLTPTPTPSPTPAQPTIIINNNATVHAPAMQASPTAPPVVYVPVPTNPTSFNYSPQMAEQFLFAQGNEKYHGDRYFTRAYVQEGLKAYYGARGKK